MADGPYWVAFGRGAFGNSTPQSDYLAIGQAGQGRLQIPQRRGTRLFEFPFSFVNDVELDADLAKGQSNSTLHQPD